MFGEGQQYSKGKTQENLKEILSGENPGNHLGGETCIQQAAQHTRRPQTTLLRERNDPPPLAQLTQSTAKPLRTFTPAAPQRQRQPAKGQECLQ